MENMENKMDTIEFLPNSQSSKNMHSLIDKLQEKVNQIVAKREFEIYRATKRKNYRDERFSKINNWVNSSAVRSAFARLALLAFYENNYISIEKVIFELNISRPAAKTMVDFCLRQKWICHDKVGSIQASPFSVDAFSKYVRKMSEKTYSELEDFYTLSMTIKTIQEALKTREI